MVFSYFQRALEPKNVVASYKKFVEMDISDSIAVLKHLEIALEESCD